LRGLFFVDQFRGEGGGGGEVMGRRREIREAKGEEPRVGREEEEGIAEVVGRGGGGRKAEFGREPSDHCEWASVCMYVSGSDAWRALCRLIFSSADLYASHASRHCLLF